MTEMSKTALFMVFKNKNEKKKIDAFRKTTP